MRKRREIQCGATYHVTAKTNRGEFLLNPDEVKDLLYSVILGSRKKYDYKLVNFCIMSNHIHLMIEPAPGTSLSNLMRWILSTFAIRFNKFYGLTGHVWQNRFKSVIVRSFIQFINTFKYISENPVKAGICLNAGNYFYCGLYELKKKCLRLLDPPDDWLKLLI